MGFVRSLLRFCADDQGVGSIWMLCLLPLLLVLTGLGMDGTAAFRTRDMLQSTADAAALAGALQLPTTGAASTNQQCGAVNQALSYAQANMSVAGFGNVLNAAYTSPSVCTPGDVVFGNWDGTTFTTPAPAGTAGNAVEITVKTATANGNPYPTSFLALIGKSSWDIAATAIAINGVPRPICLLSLSTTGTPPALLSDGLPHSNLSGCTIGSNNGMTCHGARSDGGAEFGISAGADNGCGKVQESNQPTIADTYSGIYDSTTSANNLAMCGGTFAGQTWNSAPILNGSLVVCGDLTLNSDISLAPAADGTVIVIENGQLNTNGKTLLTSNTNGLTIVFSGTNSSGAIHQVTGNGTLTYSGPASGTWKNMVLYQDPNLIPTGSGLLDFKPRNPGQKFPTLNVDGIIYMPNGNFELHGSLSNNNPAGCIVLVAATIKIKGTGDILAQQACSNAPTALVPISRLVE